MADEDSDRDLFGDPVVAAEKGPGRPAHQPTRETRNRVILGFARGRTVKEVALSIGVSVPTLRQHYSSAVVRRHAMALMVESVQLGRLNDQAEQGNVTAEKELIKALEKGRVEQLSRTVADRHAPRPKPKGKKEAAKEIAHGVEGRFAPPAPPSLLDPAGNA